MPSLVQKLREGFENRSVLIIDDDLDVAQTLAKILKVFFIDCVITGDGEHGLATYIERQKSGNPFTLVVTDLEMPKMGGIRIIKEIKSIEKDQAILILSAHDGSELMAEAVSLNVYGYLLKPLAMDKLFASLEKIFSEINFIKRNDILQRDQITGWKQYSVCNNEINLNKSEPVTIIYIKINHLTNMFKIVGDSFTNTYLSELALLLEGLLLETENKLYKISTDELCFVLEGEQIEYATTLAKDMLSVIRYFHTSEQGIILNSTLSIGIAYGSENTLLHAKLAIANTNAYFGGLALFSQDQIQTYTSSDGRDILKMLFKALDQDQIIPFIQPIIDLKTNQIMMYQSLIRIREENYFYGPEAFLQLAIDMGQMLMITRAMIKNTFRLVSSLPKKAILAITLSSADLNDEGLIGYINFWADKYNIVTSEIAFLIRNEMDILENKYILDVIKEIKISGYKIIIDNFGLSQCNIGTLLELQPDFLRLQPDTMQRLENDSRMSLLLGKIIEIAHILGSQIIISHISDKAQIKFLHNMEIDLIQGFAIAKPYELLDE